MVEIPVGLASMPVKVFKAVTQWCEVWMVMDGSGIIRISMCNCRQLCYKKRRLPTEGALRQNKMVFR